MPTAGLTNKSSTVGDAHLRALGRSLASAGIAYSTGAILTSHRVLATGAEKRRAKNKHRRDRGGHGNRRDSRRSQCCADSLSSRFARCSTKLTTKSWARRWPMRTATSDRSQRLHILLRNPATMLKLPRHDAKPLARNRFDRRRTHGDRVRGQRSCGYEARSRPGGAKAPALNPPSIGTATPVIIPPVGENLEARG